MGFRVDSSKPSLREVLELVRTGEATKEQRFELLQIGETIRAGFAAMQKQEG